MRFIDFSISKSTLLDFDVLGGSYSNIALSIRPMETHETNVKKLTSLRLYRFRQIDRPRDFHLPV